MTSESKFFSLLACAAAAVLLASGCIGSGGGDGNGSPDGGVDGSSGSALRTVDSPDEIFPLPLLSKEEAVGFAHSLYETYRELVRTPGREVKYALPSVTPLDMEGELSAICLVVRDRSAQELTRALELDEASGTSLDVLQKRRMLMWLALSLEYDRSEPFLDRDGNLVEAEPEYVNLCDQ